MRMAKRTPAWIAGVLFFAWGAHAAGTADLACALAVEGRWTEAHREALRLLAGDASNATGRLVAAACHAAFRTSEMPGAAGELASAAGDPSAAPGLRALARYALGIAAARAGRIDEARAWLGGCLDATTPASLAVRAACVLDETDRRHPPPSAPPYAARMSDLRPRFTPALRADAVRMLDTPTGAGPRTSPPVVGGIVRFYRSHIRPAIGSRCSLQPSCSEYFLEAGRQHGALAVPMIADRLFREPSVVSAAEEPVMVDGKQRIADPVERHYPAAKADKESHAH